MNLHVIIGEDDYLIDETAKKLVWEGAGLEVIDSLNSTNAELQLADIKSADASFSTPPFLEPSKVTWWKNVHFLPPGSGKKATAADVKEALERFAAKLARVTLQENQRFILSGPHLLKTSVVAKTLAKVAEVVQFSAGAPWEKERMVMSRVVEEAKQRGYSFAPGAAERFVATVGTDMRSLISELDKLRDYLGDGAKKATVADVENISSEGVGVEAMPWNVTDAIGRRDIDGALTAMKRFELENGFDVMMSTIIEKFFRQMLACSQGRTEGIPPNVVRKSGIALKAWTPQELAAARTRFFRLREKVVSGTREGNALVVLTLVRVMRKAGRR